MKNLLLIGLFVISQNCLSGQSAAAFEKAAANARAAGNYYAAMRYYGNMLLIDSSDVKAMMGYAEAARAYSAYDEAEIIYKKMVSGTVKNPDPRAAFLLASITQDLGRYEEAKGLYQSFLAAHGAADTSYLSMAQKAIYQCDFAKNHAGNPDLDIEIEHLPEPINSPKGEYAPQFSNEQLYFSTNRFELQNDPGFFPNRDIYKVMTSPYSETSNEITPSNFNDEKLHTANSSFSRDGQFMFYNVCKYTGEVKIECQIWRRERMSDGDWGIPTLLPEPINAPEGYTSTEPNVGFDPKTGSEILFWASNRMGTKGQRDLFMAPILKDGTFGNPQPLDDLNTAGDDITPFFHEKTQTLYFSTDGRPTLGGFDVFKSVLKYGAWSAVSHLPAPINSNYNDAFYMLKSDESEAYFCSNRKTYTSNYAVEKEAVCCYDIFKAKYRPLEMVAINFIENTPDSLRMTKMHLYTLNGNGSYSEELKVDVTGAFYNFPVSRGESYMIVTEKDGWKSDTVLFDTKNLAPGQTFIKKELFLAQAKIDLVGLTFDKSTGTALAGCTMRFVEKGGPRSESEVNASGNFFDYSDLKVDRKYWLFACKTGYSCDSVEVSTMGFDRWKSYKLERKLYLAPLAPEQKYLPLVLYFDNDEPDKDTDRPRTSLTYKQSYDPYYNRKGEFVRRLSTIEQAGKMYEGASDGIALFFENEVKKGYENLFAVSPQLLKRLNDGDHVELVIQGFASPRSNPAYNKALTGRRIWSVKNHFMGWENGALSKYINDKKLTFREVLNGEDQAVIANQQQYEDFKNEKASIYSVEASRERRVQIIEINVTR